MNLQAVRLAEDGESLILLDQTLLPNEKKFITLRRQEEIWEAISHLRVRGAPAIGIAAGYAAYLGVRDSAAQNAGELEQEFARVKAYLASSRPTAVNLFWALNRMERCLLKNSALPVQEIKDALRGEADRIYAEDEQVCRKIGENGLSLLQDGWGLMTHCNAGAIATARYGTALAPIYLGLEQGKHFTVFADETRPLLQGARLTAWELNEAGVDVTLVCDSMCSHILKQGWVNAILVGCDRVAANGDTANKIGTSTLAIVAKKYGVPFYVCAPVSTIDINCKTGDDIEIELRKPEEITEKWYAQPMAPAGVKAYNPAFDVTESEAITAFVTEKGIVYPPFRENLARLFD